MAAVSPQTQKQQLLRQRTASFGLGAEGAPRTCWMFGGARADRVTKVEPGTPTRASPFLEHLDGFTAMVDDCWRLDVAEDPAAPPVWTRLEHRTAGPTPAGRAFHSLTEWKNKLFMFGGKTGTGWTNELHVLDLESRKWELKHCKGTVPVAREGHSAVIIKNSMWVFGGRNSTVLQDMCTLNLDTLAWSLPPRNPKSMVAPRRLAYHSTVAAANMMYIFGGWSTGGCSATLWSFNTSTGSWKRPATQGERPCARACHTAVLIGNKMLVHGGIDDRARVIDDMYYLDLDTLSWTKAKAGGCVQPSGCWGHNLCSTGDIAFMFGGTDEASDLYSLAMKSLPQQWKEQATIMGMGPVEGQRCLRCGKAIPEHEEAVPLALCDGTAHALCLTSLLTELEYDQCRVQTALSAAVSADEHCIPVSDCRRILQTVAAMCRQAGHPLSLSIDRFSTEFNAEYSVLLGHASTDIGLVYKKALDEIDTFLANVSAVVLLQFSLLQNSSGEEHCKVMLKKLTLPRIYDTVFRIIVAKHCAADTILASMLAILKNVTASDLNMRPELVSFADSEYIWRSIKALQQLPLHKSPYAKVDCLVMTRHLLVKEVSAWCKDTDAADVVINGDDLVSLFEFMIIKAGLSQPHSQVSFMEAFSDVCFATGEAAYLTTTLQVAIQAIENITTI